MCELERLLKATQYVCATQSACAPLFLILNQHTYSHPCLLQLGKLKLHEEYCSVLVRIADHSQAGIMNRPATAYPVDKLKLPGYASILPPKHLTTMRKSQQNKTYTKVGA